VRSYLSRFSLVAEYLLPIVGQKAWVLLHYAMEEENQTDNGRQCDQYSHNARVEERSQATIDHNERASDGC